MFVSPIRLAAPCRAAPPIPFPTARGKRSTSWPALHFQTQPVYDSSRPVIPTAFSKHVWPEFGAKGRPHLRGQLIRSKMEPVPESKEEDGPETEHTLSPVHAGWEGPYPGSEAGSNAAFPGVAPEVYYLTFIPPLGGAIGIVDEPITVPCYVSF